MDEKTKTIIDRARAMLAAATPGPWEVCPDTRPDVRTTCNTGGFLGCGHIATVSRYDANEADAALIAAAPGMLTSLCDALESAERRAEEAEAARLDVRKAEICDCVTAVFERKDVGKERMRAGLMADEGCPDCHGSGAVIVEGGE